MGGVIQSTSVNFITSRWQSIYRFPPTRGAALGATRAAFCLPAALAAGLVGAAVAFFLSLAAFVFSLAALKFINTII